MTTHITGTRQEWLARRLELLQAEKELTHRSDDLARRRQELPWVRLDKPYRFDTDEGRASLEIVVSHEPHILRIIRHWIWRRGTGTRARHQRKPETGSQEPEARPKESEPIWNFLPVRPV